GHRARAPAFHRGAGRGARAPRLRAFAGARPAAARGLQLVAAHAPPAVDDDLGSRDEARLVRGEEQHGVRGVAAVALDREGYALLALLQQLLHVAARAL